MPKVLMPDGTIMDVPDSPSPEVLKQLRGAYDQHRSSTNTPDYGLRKDGTKKDIGFLGELQGTGRNKGEVMTEYSINKS